jgi:hypothetical protein
MILHRPPLLLHPPAKVVEIPKLPPDLVAKALALFACQL